jgi:hypothetical protein
LQHAESYIPPRWHTDSVSGLLQGCFFRLFLIGNVRKWVSSFKLERRVQEIQKNVLFFRPYRNLTDKNTNPNTLDRMKVRLAYDVFSDELIAAFDLFKKYRLEGFRN